MRSESLILELQKPEARSRSVLFATEVRHDQTWVRSQARRNSSATTRRTRRTGLDLKATALPLLMGGCQDLRLHLLPAQRSISPVLLQSELGQCYSGLELPDCKPLDGSRTKAGGREL